MTERPRRSTADGETCGVNVVFDLVGSKWKPTILWRLAEGDHRFAELRRAVGGVSEKVLAEQLKELERDGLVVREAHDGFPLRVDYRLSEQGSELNDALDVVAQWGDRYAAGRLDERSRPQEDSRAGSGAVAREGFA